MKIKKEFQKMARYRFLLLLITGFIMGQNALAQNAGEIDASGVVKDAKGEALMGVAVAVEGTQLGTVTGLDGDFTLSVPQGSMLSFSYVGFQTQKVRAAANMNIVLQSNTIELTTVEVVGIGMGTARRRDLTGAISSVSAADMRQGVITSSEQMLQGRVAGLNVVQGSGDPAAGAVMRLRGGSSLAGNSAPLVVVDGIASVDINTVQPSDIVSIDVLKDASAAAIYGSRGSNGVIIVTTKRRRDEDKVTTSANYNSYFGVASASKKLNLLTADNWDQWSDNNQGSSTDWQNAIQQTAITHSHALTFSSGSSKSGFNGALSYLNAEGVVKTTKMERYGASISGFTKVWDDRLTLEGGAHTTRDNYRFLGGLGDNPGLTNYDSGYGRLFRSAYGLNPTLSIDEGRDPFNRDAVTSPLEFLNNRFSPRSRDRLLVFAKAEVDIWNGLKGTINLSRNHVVENNRSYVRRGALELFGRGVMAGETDSLGQGGNATRAFSDFAEYQFEGYLTYDKTINRLHRMNFMGGYSYSESISEGFGAGVSGFANDDFGYDNLGAAIYEQYVYSYKNKVKLISFFGRANYTYASKYMFTATLRADGSSKFGANHKWGYFPSVSAAWRLTEEDFMSSIKGSWLNDLKLRAGFGITGNQGGIDPYMSLEGYGISKNSAGINRTPIDVYDEDGNWLGQTVPIIPIRNPNPDLKWESTNQFNAGLDFQIFRNFSGTIEFYHKNTKDLLYFLYVGADGVTTFPYLLKNIGSMTNTGVELSLNALVMQNRDKKFRWDVTLNLAHNKNKITDLNGEGPFDAGMLLRLPGESAHPYTQRIQEGYSIGSFFGAKVVGKDENGQLLYRQTVDGVVGTTLSATHADQVYLGNAMPKLTMGLGTNVTYQNFDFSLNFNGMFGQKVYNGTAMILHDVSRKQAHLNVLESALTDAQAIGISDYWLENASFLRLQSLTLGYTFDLKKIKLNSLRLYATAENLFVLTKYSGVDPELSIDMDVTRELDEDKTFPGIDYFNNYPRPRTFIFGVNLSF